jgi:signal transduction histidine kinase
MPDVIVLFAAGALFVGLHFWSMRLLPDGAQGADMSPWHVLQAAQFGLGALLAGCWIWQSSKARQQLCQAAQENEKLQLALQDRTVDLARAVPSDQQREQATAQRKSQFLSTLNHELRTPMNGVLGMTHLLLDTSLSAEQTKLAQAIRESGDALMLIIKDLLDFAEIEAGNLQVDRQPFDLRELVESCLAGIATKAQAKHLLLHCTLGPAFPETWVGDGDRTRQILLRLLDNAVKFTDSGSVALSVQQTGTSPSPARLRLEISDTGIGVESADVERLFQAFTQVDASDTRRHGGMGLGLVICQQLVQLMQGSIGFTPVQPRGSRFWVELPMAGDTSIEPASLPI